MQRDALFHFVDEEHDGWFVWGAKGAWKTLKSWELFEDRRAWLRVVRWLVWWEFRRLVVFGARWKSSGMR